MWIVLIQPIHLGHEHSGYEHIKMLMPKLPYLLTKKFYVSGLYLGIFKRYPMDLSSKDWEPLLQ